VQFFWHLAGVREEVVDIYLRKQKSELDWIKYAIHSVNMPLSEDEFDEKHDNSDRTHARLRSLVVERWVGHQADYFLENAPQNQTTVKNRHLAATVLFVLGIALSVVLFFLHYLNMEHFKSEAHGYPPWLHYFIVSVGMLPAFAAAIGGYTEKMALSAQAKRYHWMSGIFSRAKTGLDRLLSGDDANQEEIKKLIFELGKEALEENADWLIIKRDRKLEMPTGG
jgi:hypothetical protein